MDRELLLKAMEDDAVAIVYGADGKELRKNAKGYSRRTITRKQIAGVGLRGKIPIGEATGDWGVIRCLVIPTEKVGPRRRQSFDKDEALSVLKSSPVAVETDDVFALTITMDLAAPIERDVQRLRMTIDHLKSRNRFLEEQVEMYDVIRGIQN